MNSESLRDLVLHTLEEHKAADVTCLPVAALTNVTDFMVIATATSPRHAKALSDHLLAATKAADLQPLGVEGTDTGEWVLVDHGDVVTHIMLADTRAHFDLERLWRSPVAPTSSD